MRFTTLEQWLDWQTSLHPRAIELGLTRIRTVAQRLHLLPLPFPTIHVAGTNGKGSSVTYLDTILRAAGYRVGRYTSPHLLRYNERMVVAGEEVSDEQLCEAFNLIETVRNEISLTFFEFSTLAAMLIFQRSQLDIAVLEIGLGGRLDAVNIFDPTVALVTAIGIDHVDWLGADRESIGLEKAGIFRAQQPAVCSDPHPPQSLLHHAQQLATPLYRLGRDFSYHVNEPNSWHWQCNLPVNQSLHLPRPALLGEFQLQNAAGALMVLELIKAKFPIPQIAIAQGLSNAKICGRFQVIPGTVTRIFDVAHNPLGAQVLAELLQQHPGQGETHAVIGMLKDKDIASFCKIMLHCIQHWHIAPLNSPRTATSQHFAEQLTALGINPIHQYPSITAAYKHLLAHVESGSRIIVCGSFYSVAEALTVELG